MIDRLCLTYSFTSKNGNTDFFLFFSAHFQMSAVASFCQSHFSKNYYDSKYCGLRENLVLDIKIIITYPFF